MTINHIGYAVKRIDRAIDAFERLGFAFGPKIEDEERNVMISFGEKDGYRIELISPTDKNRESPVDQYLSNTTGIPYHICYESIDFEKDIEELCNNGYKIVIDPKPAVAFDGRKVVFMISIGIGLIEILEA